jgi:hypothetical protein
LYPSATFPSSKTSRTNGTKSYDGQAGAAALTIDIPEDLFMKNLYSGLKKTGLPSYAMPRLVRITKEYAPSVPHPHNPFSTFSE